MTADPPGHGTLARYHLRACRCEPCAQTSRDYAATVRRLQAYGRWQPFVDAEPVREHLRDLSAHGIGWKRAAELAGVSTGGVSKLLYGCAGRPPNRRVRAETAAKLLAVRPDAENLRPGALVDAAGTRRRLQALVAAGWPQTHLAQALGVAREDSTRLLRADMVQRVTALSVRAVFEDLAGADPQDRGVSAVSAKRARLLAARRGWLPASAWWFADIDDPAASPDPPGAYRPRRSYEEIAEDALFVLATAGPMDRAAVACRLGVQVRTLDRAFASMREHSAT